MYVLVDVVSALTMLIKTTGLLNVPVTFVTPLCIELPPIMTFTESVMAKLANEFPASVMDAKNEDIRMIWLVEKDGVIVTDMPVTSTKLVLVVDLLVESVARTTCNTFPPAPVGINVHVLLAVRTRLPPCEVVKVSGVPLIVTVAAGTIVTVPAPMLRKFS